MARIISYADDQTVSVDDRLLGSDYNDLNKTKEFRIGDILDLFQDEVLVSTQGPQGIQGPIGPQGVAGNDGAAGPIGPAGLEWQGIWSSGASYIQDDAVSYDGASWFCILATSGTITPNLDTTHWALLASQGAVGPAGLQGPIGPQGPSANGVLDRGDWITNTDYAIGDVVKYWQNQSYYYCKTAHNNSFNPEQSSDWLRLGINKVTTNSNFKGQGTYADPLTNNFYKRSNTIYASGTNNPLRIQNYFTGMELPDGVSESFVRVSTGTYQLRYTGDISIPYIDLTNFTYYHEVMFSNNPDVRHTLTNNTVSGSDRTLVITFTNTVGGVLTDGFFRLLYSIKFYKQ